MGRVTPETRAAQLKMIQDSLERDPNLTKWHFVANCGCNMRTMNQWELAGLVKFGQNKRPKAAKYTKKAMEQPVPTAFRVDYDTHRPTKGAPKKPRPKPKQCAMCGGDFEPRKTESIPEFNARMYCGTTCANDAKRGRSSPIKMREATDELMAITNGWAHHE